MSFRDCTRFTQEKTDFFHLVWDCTVPHTFPPWDTGWIHGLPEWTTLSTTQTGLLVVLTGNKVEISMGRYIYLALQCCESPKMVYNSPSLISGLHEWASVALFVKTTCKLLQTHQPQLMAAGR